MSPSPMAPQPRAAPMSVLSAVMAQARLIGNLEPSQQGGTPAILGVWNTYNRVNVSTATGDNTDNWTYASTTYRSANNCTGNRSSLVNGLNEEGVHVLHWQKASNAASEAGVPGMGLDSTSVNFGLWNDCWLS